MHSENYFGEGGYDLHVLGRLRADYPVSLHGVGLGLASVEDGGDAHSNRLKRLVRAMEPALVSEHLCWSAIGGQHFNDLLPLPYTAEALPLVAGRVERLQDRLGTRVLVENVCTYVELRESEMGEGEFIAELCRRAGCGVLLDVNNLHVNRKNHDADPVATMAAIPREYVAEIHLATTASCPVRARARASARPLQGRSRRSRSSMRPARSLVGSRAASSRI